MAKVFVLQNQHKQLLNKQGLWTDGREANTLYRTEHKDEATNQVFEVSSKDYTLRVSTLQCALNDKGVPQISAEDLPPLALAAEPSSVEENVAELDSSVDDAAVHSVEDFRRNID